MESYVDCPAFLAFGFEEGVVEDLVDACSFCVVETETAAEKTCEMQGKPILDDFVIKQNLARIHLVLFDLLLSERPFQQVRLRMHQAAYIVSFDGLLSFLSKDDFERLVYDRRLLEVLKASNSAFQYDQAQFEDIQSPLSFEIGGLRYRTFHEIFLSHIHLEDAKSQQMILGDFLRGFEVIDGVGVDVGEVIIQSHA